VSDIATIAEDLPATLTPEERNEFARLEAIIDRGIQTFAEVGSALLVIRDDRLYRATHATFEAYCRERWDMTRCHANRVIGAARIVAELEMEPMGSKPLTERQVRPLAGLTGDQAREVWELASSESDGQPTFRDVERARQAVLNPPTPEPPPYPPTHVGMPVPAGPRRPIHDLIIKTADEARAQERADLLASLSSLRDTLSPECRERFDTDAFACRQSQDLLDELRKRYRAEYAIVGKGRPGQFVRILALVLDCLDPRDWTACSSCSGHGCDDCKGLGYIVAKESKGAN